MPQKNNKFGKNFDYDTDEELLDFVIHLFRNSSGGSQVEPSSSNTNYGTTVQEMINNYATSEFEETCIDVDYYYGKQWSADDIALFQEQGMDNPGFKNLFRQNLDTLIGVGSHLGARPLAKAVNVPSDDDKAAIATSIVDFVWNNNQYLSAMRDRIIWHLVVPGTAAMELTFESKTKDSEQEICYNVIEWDRFSYDQKSRKLDFSDCNFFFHRFWSDLSSYELEKGFKITQVTGWEHLDGVVVSERSHSYYHEKDFVYSIQVLRAVINYKDEWWIIDCLPHRLLSVEKSPFQDHLGRSVCPIKAQSFYCDQMGMRHGLARDLRASQRDFNLRNYHALKSLEPRILLNLLAIEIESVDELNDIQRIIGLRVNDGFKLEDVFKYEDLSVIDEKQFELMRFNENYMANTTGVSEYLQGAAYREDSGYAQDAKAHQALVRVARLLNPLYNFETNVATTTYNIARDFWDEQRIIRVTDDPQTVQHVVLNQTITLGDLAQRQLKEHVDELALQGQVPDPAYIQQIQRFISEDPEAQEEIAIQNNVAEPGFDFVFTIVPEKPSQQSIEVSILRELATHQNVPELASHVWRLILANTEHLKGKREMLAQLAKADDMRRRLQEKELNAPSDAEVKAETAEITLDIKETEKEIADIKKDQAEEQAKSDIVINKLKQGTERWKAQNAKSQPKGDSK